MTLGDLRASVRRDNKPYCQNSRARVFFVFNENVFSLDITCVCM
jgi:hypothetical protein